MKELRAKILEALISALPITAIVYIMALTPWFQLSGAELITFTVGGSASNYRYWPVNLGADLAMTPMGTNVGSFLVIAVLLSVIREDRTETIMNLLEEKFATIRNGKGIAFAVPMSSVIGVNLYQFLSNNRQGRGIQPCQQTTMK